MKRNLLLSKKYLALLFIILNVFFAVNIVNGATYYSRGSFAPNLTSSWRTNPDGSGSQPGNFTTAGDIFTIQNGHSMSMSANWSVTGNVAINNGGTLTTSTRTITISGTFTVGSGSSGTFNINSTSGSKNFYGLVTINSGATWNNSANEAVTVRGGIVNNGTFNAGTGTYSFNTNAQVISGTISIPNVSVTGITLTNNGNLTVGTALSGTTGTLTNNGSLSLGGTCSIGTTSGGINNSGTINRTGSGSTTTPLIRFNNTGIINLGGSGAITGITNNAGGTVNLTNSGTITSFNNATSTSTFNISDPSVPTITTLTATVEGNTVNYIGAAQTAKVTTYSNLTISGTGIKTFATTPTVNGVLSMEQTGTIMVTTGVVTYGADATLQYNKPAAYTATTEEWPATFSGTGGVQILNSGVITFGAAKAISNSLSLAPGSGVNLGIFTTHSAGSLTFGGNPQLCGTWGSTTATSATYHNNSYFAATVGYISVGSVPAAPTGVTPGSGVDICTGSGINLNATSSGNSINWYTISTGGISIGSSASGADFFVSPTGNTTYYAETQTSGGCLSVNRTATATISVNAQITENYLDIPNSTHTTVCATAAENNNVVISAPAGNYFVDVDFASYGTPNGTCESFTIGGCHAATSMSVCEGYLLGNSSATIPATNGVFTDPCVGTVKRLYVQAVYNSTQYEICEGSSPGTITGSVPSGGNGTYTYLWESSTTNSSSGFAPASGTNNSIDYTPGTLTQTTWFRRTVTSGGCNSSSDAVEITVNPTIAITNPGAQIACESYTLPAITGANLSGNQNYFNNSQALGGSVITGPVTTTQTVWIYDTDGTCSDEESFLVTIINKPSIAAISTPSALCAGSSLNPTTPMVTANGAAVTVQGWEMETTVGGGVFASLSIPYSVLFTDNGKKLRYYATNTCGTANSNEVIVSVTALPIITTQPSPLTLCEGESGNIVVVTSSPSPSYQWQYSAGSTGPWTNTDGAASVSGHTTDQLSITNVPLGYNNFYVSCIITSNSCSIQSNAVLISVNPVPVTGEIIPD